MLHVFVETNFIVDVLRPLASPDAKHLRERARRGELRLYIPWCSFPEAARTISNIIKADLGFSDSLRAYLTLQHETLSRDTLREGHAIARQLQQDFKAAFGGFHAQLEALKEEVSVIEPTEAVVWKTLEIYPVKRLPPFDEMVLGAVLAKATELHRQGDAHLYFCNLNKRDFQAEPGTSLDLAYRAVGLRYLDTFKVPE